MSLPVMFRKNWVFLEEEMCKYYQLIYFLCFSCLCLLLLLWFSSQTRPARCLSHVALSCMPVVFHTNTYFTLFSRKLVSLLWQVFSESRWHAKTEAVHPWSILSMWKSIDSSPLLLKPNDIKYVSEWDFSFFQFIIFWILQLQHAFAFNWTNGWCLTSG